MSNPSRDLKSNVVALRHGCQWHGVQQFWNGPVRERQGLTRCSSDFALYPYYYCILLVVGCIVILIFVMTVIGLTFSRDNYMCQNDWLLNQGKCYKFSTSSRTWNESQSTRHICRVIHTLREMEFIQKSLKPEQPSWIGLYIIPPGKQRMWINEHSFVEQKDFSIIGPTDSMSCAITIGNQVSSEDCDSKFYGICHRDV